MTARVLVVDEGRELRQQVAGRLARAGARVVLAADATQAWAGYRRSEPDLALVGLTLPRDGALELLRRIREVACTPVVMAHGAGHEPRAAVALRLGAEACLRLPQEMDRLESRVRRVERDLAGGGIHPSDALAGSSTGTRRLRERLARLGRSGEPVWVHGRCALARAGLVAELHAHGPAAEEPLRVQPGQDVVTPPTGGGAVHLVAPEALPAPLQAAWAAWLGRPGPAQVIVSSRGGPGRPQGLVSELFAALGPRALAAPPLSARLDDLRELIPVLVRRMARMRGLADARVPTPVATCLRALSWGDELEPLLRVLDAAVERSRGRVGPEDVERVLDELAPAIRRRRGGRSERQRDELSRLLAQCDGNLAEVARRLGVSRGSVVYRLHKLGLDARAGAA